MLKTSKIKEIPINRTDKIVALQVKQPFTVTYELENDEIVSIECKPRITVTEQIAFCNSVVTNLFDDDVYYPTLKQLVINQNFLAYFTNVKLPKDSSELCLNTDIIERIVEDERFNIVQYFNLLDCIDEAIEFKKQQILNKNPLADLIENINGIITKFGKSFDGIDIKDAIGKLGSIGSINEKNLVDAFINVKEKQSEENTSSKYFDENGIKQVKVTSVSDL